MDASPAQSPTGPLAAAQSRAGRGPRRPSRCRPSLVGCGSKSQGRPSPRSDPVCARSAGRLGLLLHGWSAHFSSLGGGAGGVTSAQFGKRDVEKILSIRFPQSPFLGVSLLLSLTLSPLNSGGGGRDPANLSPGARGKGIGGPMCSPIPAPDVIRSDLGQASSGKAEWEDGSA